ncbi:MAG: FHA domain-containing protein FhaB/FipA [Angustibacter sp.]
MNELTVTLIRFSLLAVLWVFVFSIVGVLRSDLFGTKLNHRTPRIPRRTTATVTPPRSVQRRTPGQIAVTEGPLTGTMITLDQQAVLIGRNPESTLVLNDDFASARHARIYPENGEWFVEDLGSTNGTFSDTERIYRPIRLEDGSTLRIGTTVLELRR